MAKGMWRMAIEPLIEGYIAGYKGGDVDELRRYLKQMYPFGLRRGMAGKVWESESRRQVAEWMKEKRKKVNESVGHIDTEGEGNS